VAIVCVIFAMIIKDVTDLLLI